MAAGTPESGTGDHHIGLDLVLPGQLAPQLLADHVDVLAEDVGVGPGKVDKLEDAGGRVDLLEGEQRLDLAVLGADDDLARFDLADELGLDQVQGTALRGHHLGIAQLAEAERSEAMGIAHGDHAAFGQKQQAVGPLDPVQGLDDAGPRASWCGRSPAGG